MKFKFIFLSLLIAVKGYAVTPANTAPAVSDSKNASRPAMPDGLYLGNILNRLPFLLVDKGKWIDPYEWVERNSLDEFNRQFVQGQKFESFNVNTWLNTIEEVTFYATSPQLLLSNGQIKNGTKAQVNVLAPSLTTYQCASGGTDVWQCNPTYKVSKGLPRGSCGGDVQALGCRVSIITNKTAYQKLTANHPDAGVLNVEISPVIRQIQSQYKAIFPPSPGTVRIETNAFSSGVIYGPDKQKLIVGSMELGYRTNLKWKASYSGEVGPARWEALGYIWDVERARFVYLQKTAKVLNETSEAKCAAGLLRRYCTDTYPIGMWAVGKKLYTVWLHNQVVATYIPKLQAATPYDGKLLSGKQFEIVEVDLNNVTSTSIFETKSFLGLN